jgi:ADP-ribose pyrophosphatase
VEPWRRFGSERLLRTRVFDLDRVLLAPPDGRPAGEYYRIEAPDWVNIVPLTDDAQVVLVRQFRFGTESFTLEIPGGMCDDGEAATDAARREMREETGYDAPEVVPLGWVHPNPALQGNRCHSFLALGAHRVGAGGGDADEQIEIELVPLAEIPERIREGAITHSLVISAFHLLSLRRSP